MFEETGRQSAGTGTGIGLPDRAADSRGALLRCERTGAVAVLRLNRPAARNALCTALVAELDATLTALDADPEVRAVVLTGAPPGFCAGSDLKELARLSADGGGMEGVQRHEARTGEVVRAIGQLGIPVVAAVEGFAIGGGFLLATGCDAVITAANARWHLPEVTLGWVPPWGLQSLVDRVGPATAKRLAWGDRSLTGRDLHRVGAVDEVAPPGYALRQATAYANRLAALPPHALASTKRALAGVAAAREMDARTVRMFGADAATATALASLTNFARTSSEESR